MSEAKPIVLVVEDDKDMALLNARLLNRHGYDARVANNAGEARTFIAACVPDLIVLDVELPDGDGFSLCGELRQITDTPVLFLTGKTETKYRVTGLNAGGDYYLTKPYDRDEFLAVVRSLLNRMAQIRRKIAEVTTVELGPLTLNLRDNKAMLWGSDAGLTAKEFALLLLLAQNPDKELSAETIYQRVWGASLSINTGIIRKHISQIKKKLDLDNIDDFDIMAVYGGGYILVTN